MHFTGSFRLTVYGNVMPDLLQNHIFKIIIFLLFFSVSYSHDFLFFQNCHCSTLWKKIYIREFGQNKKGKPKGMSELLLKTDMMKLQDQTAGYWKRLHFRALAACDMNKWKRQLGLISCHTGLPSQTEQILRCEHSKNRTVFPDLFCFYLWKSQSKLVLLCYFQFFF